MLLRKSVKADMSKFNTVIQHFLTGRKEVINMKKFIGTILLVFSTMMMIATVITSFIFGGKMIITLVGGVFDLYFGIGFIISTLSLGFFAAIMRVFGDMCDVEVEFTDSNNKKDESYHLFDPKDFRDE